MLLFWLVIGFSATNVIVFQHVFHWLRVIITGMADEEFYRHVKHGVIFGFRRAFLGRLFRCHTCMGFWIGVALCGFGAYDFIGGVARNIFLEYVCAGLLQSVFNTVVWLLLLKLGAKNL
jgi:hypothetical protein